MADGRVGSGLNTASRPTVVLIHGLIGSSDYYKPTDHIHGANVVTIELHGYGGRRATSAELLTLTSQAELVADRIERIGRVWLLGHSMGGAIAMMVAQQKPDQIAGIINVEGNFTLKDAFWSRNIATTPLDVWRNQYRSMKEDVRAWLLKCHIEPTDERKAWGDEILSFQPAETVHAMSNAIIKETSTDTYRDSFAACLDYGIPIHLIAGARSAGSWDVPLTVRRAAKTDAQIANAGHLMMLEQPAAYGRAVDACLGRT